MWKFISLTVIAASISAANVEILEPAATAYSRNIELHVTVEEEKADSVVCWLNNGEGMTLTRLCTDWYTYMANQRRHGSSDAVGPRSSDIFWSEQVTGTNHEFCTPVVVEGIVYYASDDEEMLYALRADNGDQVWQFDLGDPALVDAVDDAVTVTDGRVYVPADSAWCLDAATGDRIWAFKGFESDWMMNGTPAVSGGMAYFTAVPRNGADSCRVYQLDAVTGSSGWSRTFTRYTTGCVTLAENMLLLPTAYGPLYAMNAETGETIWSNTDAENGYWDSSPLVQDGVIYIGGRDEEDGEDVGCIHAFDLQTGALIWESKVSDYWKGVEATPALYKGKVFAGFSRDWHEKGFVCALDKETGIRLWTVKSSLHGSVGVAGGVVYWAEHYGRNIYAVSAGTGRTIWKREIPAASSKGMQSSPSITDGIMYVAATDGNLYAFGKNLKYSYTGSISAESGQNRLRVTAWDSLGTEIGSDNLSFTVSAPPEVSAINFPNPFNAGTVIKYRLFSRENVTIRIFDVRGSLVTGMDEGIKGEGEHYLEWDGRNDNGSRVESGIYFCRISTSGGEAVRKFCVIR
ncbi:MAG: PQQ-binding-like beta-propeller repeat protein [Candidatus Latescibacteria bacterium]|nr:PQQ-binding-like beta-propeller repeat protein [bacterium]MBD3424298.1 PQQ-binding-like beta-propeller repeat protein [Candidatus Latescibacterota bacterium]